MFLIFKKRIFAYTSGGFNEIKGNINQIKEKIKIHYTKSNKKNLLLNYFLIGTIDQNKDITIIDTTRKNILKISKHILRNIGLDKILRLLFGMEEKTLIELSKHNYVEIYGDIKNINYIKKNIKTYENLLKYTILINNHNKNIFHEYYSTYSYELGKNQKINNQYISNTNKGVDKIKKIAKEKAISEAIERVSASIYPRKTIKYNEEYPIVYSPYMHPKEFNIKKTKLNFCKIRNITNKSFALCPADILFYPYKGHIESWKSNSSGMATHNTKKKAIENGIYETIERDAFIRMRLLKRGIYRIDNHSLPQSIQNQIKLFEKKAFNIDIFAIILDNYIPVCLIRCNKNKKSLFGLGAGNSIENSIKKALEEINFNNFKITLHQVKKDIVLYHIRYYLQAKNQKKISRLLESPLTQIQDIKKLYNPGSSQQLMKYYKQKGKHFLVYEYKNTLNKVFKRKTIRIISENFIPIRFGHGIPKQILNDQQFKTKSKINFDLHPLG